MPKSVTTASDELMILKERIKKLAMEKSYNELIIRLMNRVSTVPGLENTVNAMMKHIMDVIGGTNIILYYKVDQDMHYADVYGKRKKLDAIDDALVRKVVASRQPIEIEEPFSETRMTTPEFSKAYTWIFPLVVDPDLIGVIKIENLNIGMRNFYKKLPTFFAHAALILKNEIMGHTRLQEINTELEQVNRKLLRQQVFLEAIMENIADGIVACDENGLLTLFNRATSDFHGIVQERLPPDQWAGHYDLFLADGVTPMPVNDIPLYKAFKGEDVKNVEMVIAPRQGQVRSLLASGKAMFDENGNKLGAVVSMHDITGSKLAEKKLKTAYEKLKELDRMKSMFIASMSHELRTPLNSIMGFTCVILDGLSGDITARQEDQLNRIYRSSEHLLGLINDIIDISKIEAGRTEAFTRDFFLCDTVAEAVENIRLNLKKKGLVLEVNVSGELKMHTDDKRLFQCILNFLSNAVKFTERGVIKILAKDEGNLVAISVSDTGIGMAKEDMARLFRPFERIDSHLSIQAGGTGLGLYLTKKMVAELLQGDIEVASEEGIGSTFTIRVPQNIELSDKRGEHDLV